MLLIGCLAFTSVFTTQISAATEFKIFTLQHHFAEDLLPTIRSMVGSEGTANGIQNQLIIRASHENMIEIEQIVNTLDVARENLKITVSRQNNLQGTRGSASVNGRKRFGNVEIGTNQYPSNASDGIQIGIDSNQTNSSTSSHQFINVSDDGQAYISVGQSIPFTQEWVALTRRYIRIQQTTDFVDVSTGFAVRPRLIGNQVELQVTPRLAKLNQNGYIDFEELTTTIRVNRGEWFDLGGIMQQKDEVSRAILNTQSSNQSQSSQLSILVE